MVRILLSVGFHLPWTFSDVTRGELNHSEKKKREKKRKRKSKKEGS